MEKNFFGFVQFITLEFVPRVAEVGIRTGGGLDAATTGAELRQAAAAWRRVSVAHVILAHGAALITDDGG